jgi:hypothetical protein
MADKQVTILFNDRDATKFMQHCDVFEPFKVVVKPAIATVCEDYGESHVQALLRECASGRFGVVAVFDETTCYYRDPAVKVVSSGLEWGALDDMLPAAKELV